MFWKNQDPDQSLSEEEDLNYDSPEKFAMSLSDPFENKGPGMQVLSQLEKIRKDAYQLDDGTSTTVTDERQGTVCVEDEIEFPAFNNEGDTICNRRTASMLDLDEENIHDQRLALEFVCNSDEETLSDDEKTNFPTVGNVKRYGERDTWSEANQEVEALVKLNENTGLSSKDGRSKGKPKYLFRFHSQKEDFSLVVSDRIETDMLRSDIQQNEELDGGLNGDIQKSMVESLAIFCGREVEQHKSSVPFERTINHDSDGNSVAEFLDSLQEKSGPLHCEQPNRSRGKKTQAGFSRSVSSLGDNNMDEDGLMDGLMDGGSSAHDEPVLQPKTMADQFHEALVAVCPNMLSKFKFHTQPGIGLFDKLQHVMLNEKERDKDFLERSDIDDSSKDGGNCIDVRILSRSLEAKLNVCCCAVMQDEESSQWENDLDMTKQIGEKTLTIIFSSRICGDIELEVGNQIRIQSPWNLVKVRGTDDDILLATYFLQLSS